MKKTDKSKKQKNVFSEEYLESMNANPNSKGLKKQAKQKYKNYKHYYEEE